MSCNGWSKQHITLYNNKLGLYQLNCISVWIKSDAQNVPWLTKNIPKLLDFSACAGLDYISIWSKDLHYCFAKLINSLPLATAQINHLVLHHTAELLLWQNLSESQDSTNLSSTRLRDLLHGAFFIISGFSPISSIWAYVIMWSILPKCRNAESQVYDTLRIQVAVWTLSLNDTFRKRTSIRISQQI